MLKKGTISQFTHADALAAQNEADNFGFQEAYNDWESHTQGSSMLQTAFVWFIAGIIVGKKKMLEDTQTQPFNAFTDCTEKL